MNKFKNIKGILFDFGGTIDTNGIHWSEMIWMAYETNKITVKKYNFEKAYVFAERSLNALKINETTTFYEMLIKKMHFQLQYLQREKYIGNIDIDKITNLLVNYCYHEVSENIALHKEVLNYLKNRYKIGLVSNFYGNMKTVVNEFHLEDTFTEIVDSQIIGIRKPDPLIWEASMKLMGLTSGETLIVGDSYINDIAPAKYLECKAIWLKGKTWHDQNQFNHFSADAIINSLSELKVIL